MIRLVLILAGAVAATLAHAEQPSFKCSGVVSSVQAFVCADEDLSARDAAVGKAYRDLFRVRDRRGRDDLAYQQEAWRYERDGCGQNYMCLASMYSDRLAFLKQAMATEGAARPGGDFAKTASAAIAGYNKLTGEGYTVEECKALCRTVGWCRTIDYEPRASKCYVQPVSRNDVPSAWRTGVPYDHYRYTAR